MRFGARALMALAVVMTVGLIGTVQAQQKLFVGTRYLGMGNAGVGASSDGLAVHYNPAGMAFSKSWDLELPLVGVNVDLRGDLLSQLDNIGDKSDAIDQAGILERLDSVDAVSDAELEQVLDLYLYDIAPLDNTGQGVTLQGSSGPAFRFKNWGVSFAGFGNGGAGAVIDLNNGIALNSGNFAEALGNPVPNPGPGAGACGTDGDCLGLAGRLEAASDLNGVNQLSSGQAQKLANAAGPRIANSVEAQNLLVRIVENTVAGDQTLANNTSGAITAGVVYAQVAGTYAHKILDNLAIGGNLKYMTGETSIASTTVREFSDSEQAIEDLLSSDTTESVSAFGIDLGVMWRPAPKWSTGLVFNNLNAPSFDFRNGRKYEFQPSVRIGGAFEPFKWFNVALDLDVNELDSNVIPGVSYRYVNLGTEFRPVRWFAVQLGTFSNLAANDTDPTITTGLGFNIGRFELSLAGAVSTASQSVNVGDDSQDLPREVGVAFQLAWRNDRKKNKSQNTANIR